ADANSLIDLRAQSQQAITTTGGDLTLDANASRIFVTTGSGQVITVAAGDLDLSAVGNARIDLNAATSQTLDVSGDLTGVLNGGYVLNIQAGGIQNVYLVHILDLDVTYGSDASDVSLGDQSINFAAGAYLLANGGSDIVVRSTGVSQTL